MNPLWSALSSTALISLAPNLLLLLFPKFGTESKEDDPQHSYYPLTLSLGQALAAGGLLGDVFLHALPDAMQTASHQDSDDDNHGDTLEHVGLRILIGFGIFLTLDVLIRSLEGQQHENHGYGGGGHHHQQRHPTSRVVESNHETTGNGESSTTTIVPHQEQQSTTMKSTKVVSWQLYLKSSVLLNLTADALHNLTDGLAIGAAFAATALKHQHSNLEEDHYHSHTAESLLSLSSWITTRGGLATLSILFHEIPHELGDFCVLVQAGFTRNQAIMLQFVTAIAAMIGSVLGVYCVQVFGNTLVHLTAGGFVYLSTVTLLPSVLETTPPTPSAHLWRSAQLVAFGMGVALLYSVVLLEGDDDGNGHHHHPNHHQHNHRDHQPTTSHHDRKHSSEL